MSMSLPFYIRVGRFDNKSGSRRLRALPVVLLDGDALIMAV